MPPQQPAIANNDGEQLQCGECSSFQRNGGLATVLFEKNSRLEVDIL